MSRPDQDQRVDYIEFDVHDIERSKAFYGDVFGWTFTDYGPEYSAFSDGRLEGGFGLGEPRSNGGPLVIMYAVDLEATLGRIEAAGGVITRPIFSFPGGRRFHFRDLDEYELAVWSDPAD